MCPSWQAGDQETGGKWILAINDQRISTGYPGASGDFRHHRLHGAHGCLVDETSDEGRTDNTLRSVEELNDFDPTRAR